MHFSMRQVDMGKGPLRFQSRLVVTSVNTVLTGEAKFQFLHDKSAAEIQDGLVKGCGAHRAQAAPPAQAAPQTGAAPHSEEHPAHPDHAVKDMKRYEDGHAQ